MNMKPPLQNTSTLLKVSALTALSFVLSACGGSSDDNVSDTAQFTFAVSDAPVTVADEVLVCFNGIELVGNSDTPVQFTIGENSDTAVANDLCLDANGDVIPNTRGIDLLTVTGSESENLIIDASVPAGNYGQLRLDIAEGSYVLVDGEQLPLRVPSNQLRLTDLTVDIAGNVSYTLEFDLRKALVDPVGQEGYLLKPTGLRLVDNNEVGSLTGQVAEGLLIENQCTVAPTDLSEPVAYVYLYEGADVALADMADMGGSETQQPYASAAVTFDGAASYGFDVGFVATGDYTVAWTCDDEADPEADDAVNFIAAQNATISASTTPTEVVFE